MGSNTSGKWVGGDEATHIEVVCFLWNAFAVKMKKKKKCLYVQVRVLCHSKRPSVKANCKPHIGDSNIATTVEQM